MKSKTWVAAGVMVLLIGVMAFATSPTTGPAVATARPKWQYAEYSSGFKFDGEPFGARAIADAKRQYFESFQTSDEHHSQTSEKDALTARVAIYQELGGDKANTAPTGLDIMNLIGDQGWELVAEREVPVHGTTCLFKRLKAI